MTKNAGPRLRDPESCPSPGCWRNSRSVGSTFLTTHVLSSFRPPHQNCDSVPQPDDDALNLEDTASTASQEGDELHYACKAGYAIERSNPDLASDGTSFVLGCDVFNAGNGGTLYSEMPN